MKDLYTFDKDEQSSQATYDLVNAAYASFFDYIGVKWLKGNSHPVISFSLLIAGIANISLYFLFLSSWLKRRHRWESHT